MNIFLATNSREEGRTAFSNIGSALDFVRDSHADLSPEGSALMLETATGLVPATNKAVKDRNFANRTLRFSSTNADGAATVAAISSKLDGAIQACVGLGIDPSNVGKVAELRTELEAAQLNLDATEDNEAPTFAVAILPVHKRVYKPAAK
jgi:hypothetical protein